MSDKQIPNSIFRGRQVEAQYRDNEDGLFSHNAFIAALPDLLDPPDIAKMIRRRPIWDETQRTWSAKRRLLAVQTISNYIEPLPVNIDLAGRFERMIRNGYIARNPIEKDWIKQIRAGFRDIPWVRDDEQDMTAVRSTAAGFAIIGTSGVGKSTAIESVLTLFDQIIVHTEYNGHPLDRTQLVWLKLECPYNGSTKGLCMNFFRTIDAIIGTRYYQKYVNSRESVTHQLLPAMAQVASILGLGVLVIDEIQRLDQAKSGGAEEMLNFFVELVNSIGVPVVLIGTFKVLPLVDRDFAYVRRYEGQGDLIWTNMAQNEEWDFFIESLWEYQWTNVETKLTPNLNQAIYEESQGIIDIAAKLYMLAQWSVIGQEDERITPRVIRDVAKESLRLARPILEALRTNDIQKLSKINDVFPAIRDLDPYLNRAEERVTLEGNVSTLRNQQRADKTESGPEMTVVNWLVTMGFEPALATKAAKLALAKHANDTELTGAIRTAFQIAQTSDDGSDTSTTKKTDNSANKKGAKNNVSKKSQARTDDLRDVVAKGKANKTPAYESLKEVGVIKSMNEILQLPKETV